MSSKKLKVWLTSAAKTIKTGKLLLVSALVFQYTIFCVYKKSTDHLTGHKLRIASMREIWTLHVLLFPILPKVRSF